MAVDVPDAGQAGAGQNQQVLPHRQIVHLHHPQLGVLIAQVQHRRHVPRVAVLKGDHPAGGVPRRHFGEHFVPGGAADRLGVGEQLPQGDVGERPLHPLIGHPVLAQQQRLVLAGQGHPVADMVQIIGPQDRVLDAVRRFLQHLLFPGRVMDGQAVGLFVLRHLHHRPHPPLKQSGQLSVHRVDLLTGLFQGIHGGSLPSLVKIRLSMVCHAVIIPYTGRPDNRTGNSFS